jgi:four helix bundle protein
MRRAASSLGMNIAEGCGRAGSAELRQFLRIAVGSATELDYQLLLARDLKLLKESDYLRLHDRVGDFLKMTVSLIRKLKTEN